MTSPVVHSAWEVKDRKLTHARNSDFTNFSNYITTTFIQYTSHHYIVTYLSK